MYGYQFPASGSDQRDATEGALVGTSLAMREMTRVVANLAQAEVNLLIQGEHGTGKRALAEAVHYQSPRATGTFRAVALAGMPEHMAERDLFGDGVYPGLLSEGPNTTLYLEAIETLSEPLQRRLAGAIGAFGTGQGVRIITGTVAPLDEYVRLGRFRRELFFRLAVIRLTIPPLRERSEDIATIAEQFAERWARAKGMPRPVLGRGALTELRKYAWPGNARELQQTLEATLPVARGGEISVERIRAVLGRRPRRHAAPDVFPLRQLERDYIAAVLSSCNWNQSLAARRLGIGRNTLMRKIKSFGLGRAEYAA